MGKNLQFYDLRQDIVISLADVTKFSTLQSGLLQLGVATIAQIEPKTSKEALFNQQLLSNALSIARAKAVALTSQEGMVVTSVLSIVEGSSEETRYRAVAGNRALLSSVGGVDIALQEIELSAVVTATYQLQKKQ